jgi:hypothetical protein
MIISKNEESLKKASGWWPGVIEGRNQLITEIVKNCQPKGMLE